MWKVYISVFSHIFAQLYTITTIRLRTFPSSLKETLYLLASASLASRSLTLKQPIIYFLSFCLYGFPYSGLSYEQSRCGLF